MNWLKQNTPNSSKIISVTDPIFLYTDLYVGRNCSYGYGPNETQITSYAQQHGFGYVVVTRLNVYFNLLTPAADDSAGSLPWFTYVPNSNATLAYTNPDVKIFQVHGGM